MKISLAVILLLFNSCSLSEKKSKFAHIEFDKLNIDLSEIKINDSVEFTFEFKNSGNSILRINKVNPSCGCTIPEWKKKPIESGKSGFIKVTYYSKFPKIISEDILVYYNGKDSPVELTISGEVVY